MVANRFMKDVGIFATDEELIQAVNMLPPKLRHVTVLYYGIIDGLERTGKEVAQLTCHNKTDKPVSAGYVNLMIGTSLQKLRYLVDKNRAEKHPSGLTTSIDYWDISVRAHNVLKNLGADTIDKVLELSPEAFNWNRFMGKKSFKELTGFLAQYGLSFGGVSNPEK